jgi:hypothetical protein
MRIVLIVATFHVHLVWVGFRVVADRINRPPHLTSLPSFRFGHSSAQHGPSSDGPKEAVLRKVSIVVGFPPFLPSALVARGADTIYQHYQRGSSAKGVDCTNIHFVPAASLPVPAAGLCQPTVPIRQVQEKVSIMAVLFHFCCTHVTFSPSPPYFRNNTALDRSYKLIAVHYLPLRALCLHSILLRIRTSRVSLVLPFTLASSHLATDITALVIYEKGSVVVYYSFSIS